MTLIREEQKRMTRYAFEPKPFQSLKLLKSCILSGVLKYTMETIEWCISFWLLLGIFHSHKILLFSCPSYYAPSFCINLFIFYIYQLSFNTKQLRVLKFTYLYYLRYNAVFKNIHLLFCLKM